MTKEFLKDSRTGDGVEGILDVQGEAEEVGVGTKDGIDRVDQSLGTSFGGQPELFVGWEKGREVWEGLECQPT